MFLIFLYLKQYIQVSLIQPISRMLLGNLKELVGQIRYKFRQAGSTSESSSRRTHLEYLYRKGVRREF